MNLDDPVPIWDGDVLGGVLNAATNIFILPAVALAVSRRDYATTLVYTHVFFASMMYHVCRSGVLCLFEFEKHQMTDYLFVYRAIIWTLTRIAVRDKGQHVALFLFFTGIVYVLIEAKAPQSVLPLIGIGLPLLTAAVLSVTEKRKMFHDWRWALTTAVLIVVAGVFMFLFGASDYRWAHPLWHVFSMLASWTSELATYKGIEKRRKRRK